MNAIFHDASTSGTFFEACFLEWLWHINQSRGAGTAFPLTRARPAINVSPVTPTLAFTPDMGRQFMTETGAHRGLGRTGGFWETVTDGPGLTSRQEVLTTEAPGV